MRKFLASLLLLTSIFSCSLSHADEFEDILWYHYGGEKIDPRALDTTITEVLKTLPNGNITGMHDLVFETLVVETRAGSFSYKAAAENWQNYGIAQIRADTAEWFLGMLFERDRARFSEIYKYYDPEQTIEHNLMVNVPFSIALCAELYAWRLKGKPIDTLHKRAIAWKTYYNTSKGAGTVEGYKKRVLSWV